MFVLGARDEARGHPSPTTQFDDDRPALAAIADVPIDQLRIGAMEAGLRERDQQLFVRAACN
jgi:hypothetical protein